MSDKFTRRSFVTKTITAALGVRALTLFEGACGSYTPAPSRLIPAGTPAPEVNPACALPPPEAGLWKVAEPPAGSLYHGVYPGHCVNPDRCDTPDEESGEEDNITPADLASYSTSVGADVPVAWVYFSNNWGRSESFPNDTAVWIRGQRCVPFIRLMLRTSTDTEECESSKSIEKKYTLEKINAGCFDEQLRAWGLAAKNFGTPLIVEWGTEVNGCWFHWNGKWHGGEKGAALFRNAFRRIVRVIRDEAGARNITWAFHATAAGDPDASAAGNEWNRICRYYPGDDFIDWIGLSVYGADAPLKSAPCVSFETRMDKALAELGGLRGRKPLFILEFGAPGNHPGCDTSDEACRPAQCDAATWAGDALGLLLNNHWPEVRGFSWWNEIWKDVTEVDHKKVEFVMNLRVQSVKGLQEKFQTRLHERPGAIACPAYRQVEARPAQLRLLVPAYFNPGGSGASHWDALVEAAGEAEVVAIANPQNGPGKKSSDAYKRYIAEAATHGATVLGYVSTRYGAVPLKRIQEDVRRWLDWYEQIGGFFFDEQTSAEKADHGEDLIAHYRGIFEYARQQMSKKVCGALIVSNPGTVCSERYLTDARADVLCLYESSERAEETGARPFRDFTPPAWIKGHKPHHFAALVMQVESAETMKEYLRKAAADGFGYAYITERPPRDPSGKYCTECGAAKHVSASCEEDCNPWSRLAKYWKDEVESAQIGRPAPAC